MYIDTCEYTKMEWYGLTDKYIATHSHKMMEFTHDSNAHFRSMKHTADEWIVHKQFIYVRKACERERKSKIEWLSVWDSRYSLTNIQWSTGLSLVNWYAFLKPNRAFSYSIYSFWDNSCEMIYWMVRVNYWLYANRKYGIFFYFSSIKIVFFFYFSANKASWRRVFFVVDLVRSWFSWSGFSRGGRKVKMGK